MEKGPGRARAHLMLGLALRALGQPREALAAWRKAADLRANDATIWTNIGLAHEDLHEPADAVKAFERAVGIAPRMVEARFRLGLALRAMGQPEDALKRFDEALELDPADYRFQLERARTLGTLLRLDDAAQAFEEVLAKADRIQKEGSGWIVGFSHYWRAYSLLELQRFEEALEEIRQASDGAAHAQRAFILSCLGRFGEAEEALARSLASGPDYPTSLDWCVWTHALMGRFDKALEAAEKVGDAYARVYCLRALGRRDEARELAAAAARGEPLDDPLHFAYVCAVAGEADRASGILERYDKPWHPFFMLDRVQVHMVLGDREAALAWLARAVDKGLRRPPNAALHADLAPLGDDPRYRALLARMQATPQ